MNYVSYVTYFGNVFCIFIGNNNQQARNDRNSVYFVIEIMKNVLRQYSEIVDTIKSGDNDTHNLLYCLGLF